MMDISYEETEDMAQELIKEQDLERAFPFAAEYGHPASCGGMSLRDWFAGQALQGILANSDNPEGRSEPTIPYVSNPDYSGAEWAAKLSYKLADAMLKARNA